MLVREATEADAVGIARVVKQISEIRSIADVSLEDVVERIFSGLSRVGQTRTSVVLVGVTNDGEIAGYCAVHWVPFLFLPGGEAYITELFVRPSNRDSGLGSSLLKEAEKRATERGCARLSLINGREGESYKRSFYRKRNWIEREQMANFIFPIPAESLESHQQPERENHETKKRPQSSL